MTLALSSATEIDATGPAAALTTVNEIVPCWFSLFTVIVADPAPMAVTVPMADTVATAAFDVLHANVRPVSVFPCASRRVTVTVVVAPVVRLVTGAESEMLATGVGDVGLMTIVAEAVFPSEVAMIVADPAAMPETDPVALTVASVGSLLDHVTIRLASVFPFASRNTATACVDCPTVIAGELSVMLIVATGAGGGAATPIAAVALTPSTVAVTVHDPVLTPVTNPAEDTVATVGFELRQETTRSVATVLDERRTVVDS